MATKRMTRGRALQEITNVDAEPPPPAKKQRSGTEILTSKPNTRLTRRNSLTAVENDPNSMPPPLSVGSPVKTTISQSQMKSKPTTALISSKHPKESIVATSSVEKSKSSSKNELNLSIDSIASVTTSTSINSTKKSARQRKKRSDPIQCLEVLPLMYDRFYEQEEAFHIDPYIHKHQDINQKMRSILVDWLVEVHFKFRLQTPTLWLCVNIMDRFLAKQIIPRNRLQLLGVSSLLIACKFEEIFPPEVQDCVYITDRAYSKEEVIAMEKLILQTLDFQLCVPTGYHFLIRYLNLIHASEILKYLSFYYAERNLQEPDSLIYKPSLFAAGAVYAALVQQAEHSSSASHQIHDIIIHDETDIGASIWPDILIEESDYDESDVLPVARLMIDHVSEEPVTTSMRRLVATKKKYLNDKYHHIADFSLPSFSEE